MRPLILACVFSLLLISAAPAPVQVEDVCSPEAVSQTITTVTEMLTLIQDSLADGEDVVAALANLETIQATLTDLQSRCGTVTETWYVTASNNVNIRSCPTTNCTVVDTASPGDAIEVLATTNGWHEIQLADGTGYISAALTGQTPISVGSTQSNVSVQPVPPAASVQAQPQPQAQPVVPTAVPAQPQPQAAPPTQAPAPAPAAVSFTCDCSKACTAMLSCEEAYFQLNSCGCGRRDGDSDGVPCEDICPGG